MPTQNTTTPKPEKKTASPDWERVELEYRAGLLSLREIAANHGVSHVAIAKKAKKENWERDLGRKIAAKAEALVNKALVNKVVTAEKLVTETRLVEASAQVIADIRIGHRTDIARARTLAMKLLSELEVQTDNIDLIEQMEKAMAGAKVSSTGMMQAFQRITSTSGRIDSAKKLAEAMRVLVTMEREAYGIAEPTKVDHTSSDGSMSPKPSIDASKLSDAALKELMKVADDSDNG